MTDRAAIADRLSLVNARIEQACARSGRSRDEITLIGVTKTFPLETVRAGHEAGIADFGENKAQEFAQKTTELPGSPSLRWHFIGHLQRNKAKLVVGAATLIHGVDSARLAQTLDGLAERRDRGETVHCLLQVNVSGEDSKFGVAPEHLPELAAEIGELSRIHVTGLMTLASASVDAARVRRQFASLRGLRDQLEQKGYVLPVLSMGMSGDFEIAIEEGATHVRVGSALFGARG